MNRLGKGRLKNEGSLSVRELIGGSGTVFDHYFLREIVEAAPSPTAADNYICQNLGCMLGDGQAVRKAVRLREKCKDKPKEWGEIKMTDFRPAEMFDFRDVSFLSADVEEKIKVAESLDFVALKRPYKNWPWPLKEIAIEVEEKEVVTTFDFSGQSYPKKIKDLSEIKHPNLFLFSGEIRHKVFFKKRGLMTIFGEGGSQIINRKLVVSSRSCELLPGFGRIFPQFYKVMQLYNPLPTSTERILIFIRQEIANRWKENRSWLPDNYLGGLIYERNIPVSFERVGTAPRVVARLSIAYNINFDLTCKQIPARYHSSPIGIHYCADDEDWNRHDFDSEKITVPMKELSGLAGKFVSYHNRQEFPLEKIVNDNLLLSPPEALSDLFIL